MHLLKKTILSFIILSLLQFVHAGKTPKNIESETAIQNAVLVNINAYRQQNGLQKLTMDNNLVREAKKHSIDMANHAIPFGHKYFNKRINKLRAQIKNSNFGAENVAYNYKDAHEVVRQWVRSPGHRRNIEGSFNLTGVGVARDKQGKLYYTQIFLSTGKNGYARRRPFLRIFNHSIL